MKDQFIELFRKCDPTNQQLVNSWVTDNLGGPAYAILSMPHKSEVLERQIMQFMNELADAEESKDFSFFHEGATVAAGQAGVEDVEEVAAPVVPNVDRGVREVIETIDEPEVEEEEEEEEEKPEPPAMPAFVPTAPAAPVMPDLTDPMAVLAKAIAPYLNLGASTQNIEAVVDKHIQNGGFPQKQVSVIAAKLVAKRMREIQVELVKGILNSFPTDLVHEAIQQFTDEE